MKQNCKIKYMPHMPSPYHEIIDKCKFIFLCFLKKNQHVMGWFIPLPNFYHRMLYILDWSIESRRKEIEYHGECMVWIWKPIGKLTMHENVFRMEFQSNRATNILYTICTNVIWFPAKVCWLPKQQYHTCLTHSLMGDMALFFLPYFKIKFSHSHFEFHSELMPSYCLRISLMVSQHWFR